MSSVIDAEGRLFGRVNVVDAVTLVLIIVVAVGGAVMILTPASATSTTTVTVETGAPGYVVDAINASDPSGQAGVTAVGAVDVRDHYHVNVTGAGYNRTQKRVWFEATLSTSERNGHVYFEDSRLYVGREIRLDLGTTVVTGHVVEIHGGGS